EYRAARGHCNPAAAVRELFRVTGRGVVFFDDMDLALRDRSASDQPEDQAVFLGALDGLTVNEGVVYVFTSNLAVERIDPAFRRPGRIDLVLPFPKPDATLRRELVGRWHPDVRAGLDADAVVADTAGSSFAEIEELKNLLVLRFTDGGGWDWAWAKRQFAENREDLTNHRVGFGFAAAAVAAVTANGNGNGRH
ncbi:MAG: AAA family ATPase, partial [Fimbriiglobus sp.]